MKTPDVEKFILGEQVLEVDGGNGCTTLRMYLMPLTWTLKNSQNGKFYVICTLPLITMYVLHGPILTKLKK